MPVSQAPPVQLDLSAAGEPLHDVCFVVVDLETTGGSPEASRITEFGAVKIRAGVVLGEFACLVDPGQEIPPEIVALTGITPGMVAGRPPVEAVLPAFLEFCRGTVLVAHNARFDIGFLNANLARLCYPRLGNPSVCTAALARRLVRDEVHDCRLATLAPFFRAHTMPIHRALADARATVDVFHGLLERAGSLGVVTLEDLLDFARVANAPLFASRRHLAEGLPHAPGVYAFTSASGEVLYVGKATDLRARVRSYFGSDRRRKVAQLLKETAAVRHWTCPTAIEAAVREVRLIGTYRPRFNTRSTQPAAGVWVKLTAERYPRLAVVRSPNGAARAYLGPLSSRRTATRVIEALEQVTPLRRCSVRIGAAARLSPCMLAEMGRCVAPCDGRIDPARYAAVVDPLVEALSADPSPVLTALYARMAALSVQARYEEAATVRQRTAALVDALVRTRRLARATEPLRLVASRPVRGGGRDIVVVDAGRLVASAHDRAGTAWRRLAAELPAPASRAALKADETEEVDLVARWLSARDVVLHDCTGHPSSTVAGGRALADQARLLAAAGRHARRPASELAAKRLRRPEARAWTTLPTRPADSGASS